MPTVDLSQADLWISDEELDQLAEALERIVKRARTGTREASPDRD